MSKKIITLKKSDSMKKAIQTLSKNKISGCPVVGGSKIVGIVTETDIVNMINVHSKIQKDPDLFPLIYSVIKSRKYEKLDKIVKNLLDKKVEKFMKKNVVTINHDDDIYEISKLMGMHEIDRLPVVKNRKLVGIITKADILKTMEKMGD